VLGTTGAFSEDIDQRIFPASVREGQAMKKRIHLSASTVLMILVLNVSSYAWNNSAHMAVAFVAYQNLTLQTQARVDELVRLNPRYQTWLESIPASTSPARKRLILFMMAATWADQIRSDVRYAGRTPSGSASNEIIGYSDLDPHKDWHFIDQPFTPDGTPFQQAPVPNAGTQIPILREVLSSTKSNAVKSYALVWLLHLIGDIHQPLHASSRFTREWPKGDAGGNYVIICDPQCGSRLHSYWDALLGKDEDPTQVIEMARTLPTPSVSLVNKLDVAAWLSEALTIAAGIAYANPPIGVGSGPFKLTPEYRKTARAVAGQRVALAGARVAKILNNELR
jgi:S1/P1 Nuclease